MRAVTTATAAAVLGIKRKALDNILNRLDDEDAPKGRQGVERRIPVHMLADLFLATELSQRLGAPAREAYAVARQLRDGGSALVGPFMRIDVDMEALRVELDAQLEIAIESVVRRPRGRTRNAQRADRK